MSAPMSEQQLAEIRAISERAVALPLFVSDCEGKLQVWAESALTHVIRDGSGQITGYSLPSSYRVEDQVLETSLGSWDLGESATDDYLRERVNDLVDARAALPDLLAEVTRLREFERRLTEEVEEMEDAAREDPGTPQVARHMIRLLRMAMTDGAS